MGASPLVADAAAMADRARAFQRELISWSLAYAANGYPVFPCDATKKPRVKWKNAATTDHLQIELWWRTWPLAMIGIPMGERSALCVLDVDCKNGTDGFKTIRANNWTIPHESIEVRTPSGGAHFYFRYTAASATPLARSAPAWIFEAKADTSSLLRLGRRLTAGFTATPKGKNLRWGCCYERASQPSRMG